MDIEVVDNLQLVDKEAEAAVTMEESVLNLSSEGAVEGLLSAANASEEQVMVGYLEDGQFLLKSKNGDEGVEQQAQLCSTEDGELMLLFYSDQDGNVSLTEPEGGSSSSPQMVKIQQGTLGSGDGSVHSFFMPTNGLEQAGLDLIAGDLPRVASNDGNVLAALIESGEAVPIQPMGMKNAPNKDAQIIRLEDGFFQCSACPVKMRRLPDMRIHLRTHTGEAPYQCVKCSKRFTRGDYLTHHMRTHTGQKPHVCRVCNKAFACKVNLNRHIQLHTQEKPYSCAVCSARFARKFYLTNHMNLHLKLKPYQCVLCRKKFNQLSSLHGHVARHRQDKRYPCPKCGMRFYRNAIAKKHLLQHDKPYVFFCKKCGRSFVTESATVRHQEGCGGPIYFCKHCRVMFTSLEEYQTHVDALIAEGKKNDTGSPTMLDDLVDNLSDEEDIDGDLLSLEEDKSTSARSSEDKVMTQNERSLLDVSNTLTAAATELKKANKNVGKMTISAVDEEPLDEADLVEKIIAMNNAVGRVENVDSIPEQSGQSVAQETSLVGIPEQRVAQETSFVGIPGQSVAQETSLVGFPDQRVAQETSLVIRGKVLSMTNMNIASAESNNANTSVADHVVGIPEIATVTQNLVGNVLPMSKTAGSVSQNVSVPENATITEISSIGKVFTLSDIADACNISEGRNVQQTNIVGKVMAMSEIEGAVGIEQHINTNDQVSLQGLEQVIQTVAKQVDMNQHENPLYSFVHSVLGAEAQQLVLAETDQGVLDTEEATQHIVLEIPQEVTVTEDGETEQILHINDPSDLLQMVASGKFQYQVADHSGYDLEADGRKKKKDEQMRSECDVCQKTFSRRDNLLHHMRIHNGVKPHQCELCPQTFHHKGNYNKHMKTHTDDRPFICDVCKKAFKRMTYLKNHMRVHTGEKPFQCQHCGKSFALSSVLYKHNLIHLNKRPHPCSVCGKAFRTPHNRRNHEQKCHSKDVTFLCSTCKKHCPTKDELVQHCMKHHGMAPPSALDAPMQFVISSDHGKVVLKQSMKATTPGLDDLLQNLKTELSSDNDEEFEGGQVIEFSNITKEASSSSKTVKRRRRGKKVKENPPKDWEVVNRYHVENYTLAIPEENSVFKSNEALIASQAITTAGNSNNNTVAFCSDANTTNIDSENVAQSQNVQYVVNQTGEAVRTFDARNGVSGGVGEIPRRVSKRKHRGKVFTDFDFGDVSENEEDSDEDWHENGASGGNGGKKMKLICEKSVSDSTHANQTRSKHWAIPPVAKKITVADTSVDDVAEILAHISETSTANTSVNDDTTRGLLSEIEGLEYEMSTDMGNVLYVTEASTGDPSNTHTTSISEFVFNIPTTASFSSHDGNLLSISDNVKLEMGVKSEHVVEEVPTTVYEAPSSGDIEINASNIIYVTSDESDPSGIAVASVSAGDMHIETVDVSETPNHVPVITLGEEYFVVESEGRDEYILTDISEEIYTS